MLETATILVILGAILLIVGLIGGGLEVKEIRIPKVHTFPRVLATIIGLGLIIGSQVGFEKISSLFNVGQSDSDNVDKVTIYMDDNFDGVKKSFDGGQHDIDDEEWNDKVSSVKVPKGWGVMLYQHKGSLGDSLEILEDVQSLTEEKFNDQASSIFVFKN